MLHSLLAAIIVGERRDVVHTYIAWRRGAASQPGCVYILRIITMGRVSARTLHQHIMYCGSAYARHVRTWMGSAALSRPYTISA